MRALSAMWLVLLFLSFNTVSLMFAKTKQETDRFDEFLELTNRDLEWTKTERPEKLASLTSEIIKIIQLYRENHLDNPVLVKLFDDLDDRTHETLNIPETVKLLRDEKF